MILVRQVFQVKFGHMDQVLAELKKMQESGQESAGIVRVLTDLSGNFFTLVFESKAESMDAFMEALQAGFEDPAQAEQMAVMMQHVESGYREFYNIEYEA